MESVQFVQCTPQQLQHELKEVVKNQLSEFLENYKPKQPNDYLTRYQVAEMFKVDISTIHNWCKAKKLKPLGIGNRVYFLRSEIENSLTPLNL